MQQDAVNFESEMDSYLGEKMREFQLANPSVDTTSPDFLKQYDGWYKDGIKRIRRSVYQEALADLRDAKVPGIFARERDEQGNLVSTRSTKDGPVDDSESDLFGELYAEPGSPADDFATIRQNLYQMGEELPYYEDWIKDRPGKMMSAAIGFTVKATQLFEGSARGLGEYVGRKAVGWTMDNDSIAKSMGVDPKRLQDIIMRKTIAAGSAPSQPISPQFDMGIAPPEETEDDQIYRQFMDIRDAIYEENAKEEGDAWMRGARYVSEVTTPESYDRFRMLAAGADPTNPQDIRDRIGGQRTGALVKTAEMLGSAVGVLPYSIPALLTRNPKIAALLTAPFYAMGHSSAWDRRMEIYRDQLAEARALGLPEPARPSLQSLELQSAVAGAGEYVSEYTFDRFQRVLPNLMSWGGMGAPKVAKDSAQFLSKYGRELAQSLSRRNGLIGAAKVPAVAAIGGVTEGLEEALPEALKEVTDPLFIPEGYENDFFSEETAEAVGTGFIAGMLTTGGMMAAKSVPFVGEKAKRRRLAKRAAPLIVGAIQDKANRLATDRLVQNAAEARGPTMALHQIDEMAAGVRGAMFVSGDNAETTLTEDVRQRMKGAGITEKPIGMVGGMRVYAPVSMVAEVRDAIKSGDTKKLTGHPLLKDPSLPAVGALVVTNKANQIVEVIPYSSSAEAEAHAASLAHDSRLAGTTVKNVGADGLATISETIDLQVEADSTVRNLTPQQRRAGSTRKEARGILSLRGSIMQDALGSKMGRRPSEDFSSPYLTNAETQGAKNRDVEVDVILKKVDESALDENERKIALTTGVTPTILDGVVRFKIKRADGSTATIEKPFAQAGAYLGQENPDGVFLLRENGSAFTFRNALAILMHELRHKLVGTRAGAEFLTKLLYLDPEFALRGGLQYMRENARESTVERGADGSLRHLTEEELVGRYAAMHFAAEAVLSDTAGSTKRERQEAQEARATVEQFAEESLATAMEGSTGFTFAMAAEWETILKHTQDRNMRKFLGWTAAKLTEAGFAGPWAKQALYEIRQRSQGIRDQQLRVNQQMFSELAEQYKGDVKTYEEAKSGSSSAAAIAATGLATPLAALGGGEDEDKIEGAAKALADLKSAPEDQRAALASAAISALASILPTLASASASVSGVGTGGGSIQAGKAKRPADMPPRPEPSEIAARTAGQVSEVPSDQPMTEQGMVPLERELLQEGGERVSPLMAMRPSTPLEFFSALQRGIGAIEEEKLSAPAWRQRIKGLVNKGEVKQDEVDWSGLDDFLALPREGKLTKKEITGFIDSSGVQVTEGKQFDWSDNEIRLREATRRGLESWREAAAAAGIRIPAQIKRDVDLLVNRQGPWTAEVSAATGRIAEWSEEHDLDHPESFIEYEDERLLDEPAPNQFEDYTLPGGTNYRETVLTIPSERLSSNPDVAVFSSIHWPEIDNPVAHIRSKDRQGQDDAKVLFVEEIQSDWAQKGRRIGFKSSESMSMDREQTQFEEQERQTRNDAREAFSQINNMGFASWLGAREVLRNNPDWRSKPNEFDMRPLTEAQLNSIESNVDAYRKEREIGDRRAAESKKIPRAPFVENTEGWLNLSLKRVIMDAVNGGYDRVAFVSGKQSADRYDLTKKLRGIEYTKHPDGYEVKAWTVDGSGYERLGMPTRISEDRLEDYLGKELAEKIVAGQGTQYKDRPETRSLDARDMQLTGKGMVDFYDKIVPAAVNKLLKKLGGGKATIVDAGTGEQQIGFDVTDEMRTKLQESGGMPMFAMRKPGPIEAAKAAVEKSGRVAVKEQEEFFNRVYPALLKKTGRQLKLSTRNFREAARRAVDDTSKFLRDNPKFADYYRKDWDATKLILEDYYKRPLTDDEFSMFRIVMGLASPNTKLPSNVSDAVNFLDHYIKEGNFSAVKLGPKPKTGTLVVVATPFQISGTTANIKVRTVKIVEQLASRLGGYSNAAAYLQDMIPVKELHRFNREMGYSGAVGNIGNIRNLVRQATGQDELIPRMFIFGQKVGAYTLNAIGDGRFTTVDIWEGRFIRSYFEGMFAKNTGLPVGNAEHDVMTRFNEVFKEEFEKQTNQKWDASALQAVRWFYILNAAKALGYTAASTNETISYYTERKLRRDYGYGSVPGGDRPSGPGGGGARGAGTPRAADAAQRADAGIDPNQGLTKARDAMFSMRRGAVGIRDEAFLRYVDKYDELLRYTRIAAQRGVNMAGLGNPYIGARLLQGRLGAMQRASERRYAALLRRMHDAGVTLEEMDEFLTAQHAEERNNYVATINPAFPDGGSGMTTGDANNILQAHQLSGRFAMLDGFANEWRQMLNESLVQRRDAGLITQQLYDTLTTRYQRYVPLRGAPVQPNDEDFDAWGEGGGSGLSTSGRGMPRALGRQSEALSVTSQVAYVHEDAFRRIARNEIGQSFLNLVMAVGDRNMAEVIRPRRRVLAGGTVRQVHDMGWMQDQRNFGLYVNAPTVINGHTYEPGDLVVIRINNRRLADAMTTPTLELRAFERALGNVNNAWRFMTTGMGNPAFAPVNMIRDVGQATLNNLARRGFIDTAQMLMRYPRAFMRVWADNWINTQPSETAIAGRDRNMVGTYARFVAAGGDMVAWRGNDLEAKRTDFEALADRVARRDPADRGLARTLLGWYSGFFAATETAARLAQFEQRVASGESDSDAALAARDITVDFAKGGLAKPVLNTWYMFLNAGLQGTVNLAGALARSVTLAPALMMLGYAQAAIARSMGGDDEETQQSNWDNVPEYEKTGNMYFFKPDQSGKHIKVPVPYGYNVFFSAGVRLEDAVNGRGTPSDMMAGMLVDSLNAFNPIGGSGIKGGTGGVLSSVLPTMIRPLSEVALNEDFAGRRIYPQQYGKFPAPDSSLAFDGTPEAYFATAEWMNEVTGGDEFEPGLVDVSPNTLEYLVGYYFSGTGRMLNRLYKATLSNEDVTVNDIPIMRSFVGNAANDNRAISQQYNEIAADLAPDMRRADVIMSDSATPEQKRRAFAGIDQRKGRLIETLEQTDKALSEIRKMLKGAEGEDRKDLLEARRNVQKALIRRKNQLTDELAALE